MVLTKMHLNGKKRKQKQIKENKECAKYQSP